MRPQEFNRQWQAAKRREGLFCLGKFFEGGAGCLSSRGDMHYGLRRPIEVSQKFDVLRGSCPFIPSVATKTLVQLQVPDMLLNPLILVNSRLNLQLHQECGNLSNLFVNATRAEYAAQRHSNPLHFEEAKRPRVMCVGRSVNSP